MRAVFIRLHRWFGLAAALFLFISGLTGAVISWDHELDEWLNPAFFHARSAGPARPALEVAAAVEAADPRVRATFVPLATEPGHALSVFVQPRLDPKTGQPYPVDYNQVAVDPASGEVLAQRQWGAVSLARENLLPFLYKLHYSMHLPNVGGVELGIWLMGLIAIGWVFDCVIALALSFPNPRAWRKSFAFRWRKGGYALQFDLHRSGGVWLWGFVLLLAITSVTMNLKREVMTPVVSWFSSVSPTPFETRTPSATPIEPVLSRAEAVRLGLAAAAERGLTSPAGGVFYSPEFGVYGVGFFGPGNGHGDGGLGTPWLYFDGRSGQPVGAVVPGEGSLGDLFLQAQFPLHSGRIVGVPGRVFVSFMGLVIAMLSVTGVVIWARKRAGRRIGHASRAAVPPVPLALTAAGSRRSAATPHTAVAPSLDLR